MPMNKPHLAFHRLDLNQGRATPAGYLSGIKQKIRTSAIVGRRKMGSHSWRWRCEPGAYTTDPFVHDHWEAVDL